MTEKLYLIDGHISKNHRKLNYFYQFLICLVLTLVTTAVFYQVCTYDFINLDDPIYVYQNPNIRGGITLKAVEWAFNSGQAYFWHPLTWLSHILDWQLFGLNAGGHHLTNLIFHIANTLLLFIVLKQMTKALWPSAFVAALFALHPLHVESVAWIYERKDVLSTFFWMLTMWAYVRFVGHPKITNYLLIVVFLALGLMAKPMLVTLPFVLLLLDYWPLNRFSPKDGKTGSKRSLVYLLIEKVPLFAMVLVSCIVTFVNQKKIGAMSPTENLSLLFRLANASISYMQYIIKMIWPARLAVFYPHPLKNVSILYAVISAVLLLAVTILILRFARNHRYLVTGWFWYLGTLLPVIGLVQIGTQAMADRYSYITLTGLFIIIAWGLPELLGKWPHRKIVLWTSSLMVLSVLTVCAHLQLQYWKNSITVFQHALNVTKNNYVAHFSMTPMLLEQGRIDEAIWHNRQAIQIKPDYSYALNSLGAAYSCIGRLDEAINYYKRAIEINPHLEDAHLNLATTLVKKGEFAEAVLHYKIALATKDIPRFHSKFGYALLNLGRFPEAVIEYRKALSAAPDDPNILNGLGYALANTGNFDEAISLYNKALQITPDLVNIRLNLGFALSSSGRLEQAVQEYEKILLVQPQNTVAHNDIGVALCRQGKFDQAISHFNRAVQIDSNYTAARDNLNIALTEKQKTQSKSEENTKKK
jgi:tetratricopeptide (TPR) repeat protein